MNKELITTAGYIAVSKRGYKTKENKWSKDFRKALIFGYKEGAAESLTKIGWVEEIQDVSIITDHGVEYESRLIKL